MFLKTTKGTCALSRLDMKLGLQEHSAQFPLLKKKNPQTKRARERHIAKRNTKHQEIKQYLFNYLS